MKNSDMPAMPQPIASDSVGGFATTSEYCHETGLTKREYFAGLAMQGVAGQGGGATVKNMAKLSVIIADELLAELELTK